MEGGEGEPSRVHVPKFSLFVPLGLRERKKKARKGGIEGTKNRERAEESERPRTVVSFYLGTVRREKIMGAIVKGWGWPDGSACSLWDTLKVRLLCLWKLKLFRTDSRFTNVGT